MKQTKGSIRFAGLLFILATIGSLLGGMLISSAVPDAGVSALTVENRAPLVGGVLLELLNVICVLGIGSLIASALRPGSDRAATGYSVLRTVEAVVCTVALLAPLSLIYSAKAAAGFTAAIFAVRTGAVNFLVPMFFSLGALVLYASMFRQSVVPRFISIWGFVAASMIFFVGVMALVLPTGLNNTIQLALGLPIILNELFLGAWLIIKGFRAPDTSNLSSK